MARLARIIVPGMPHHITQRGNRRQDVLFMPEDRVVYFDYLRKYLGRAVAHCNGTPDPMLSSVFPPSGAIENWSAWLTAENETDSWYIRQQTHVGRPCGTQIFFDQLETLLQRDVRPKKRGRKPKAVEEGGEEFANS